MPAATGLSAGVTQQEPRRGKQPSQECEQDPEVQTRRQRSILNEGTGKEQSRCRTEGLSRGCDRGGPLRRALAEFHHRGGRRPRCEADAYAHEGAPRKQPEHIGREGEEQGANERSAETPQDCGATADIIGHIAEADQNGGYDDGVDGEDPGRNGVGEMPLLCEQRIGHRRRSAGPQGVRDHARRNPEARALPEFVRRGVPPGAGAGPVRLASGWRQKGPLDHRFAPGAPGVPTSELRPPSTRMVSPVIQRASCEARNATTEPTSSGWPIRLSACIPERRTCPRRS